MEKKVINDQLDKLQDYFDWERESIFKLKEMSSKEFNFFRRMWCDPSLW